MTESSFEGVGGLKIFTREWQPAGTPSAVVVLSHGFNSHSGYYFWVAEQMAEHGFAVYALDHRGRGKSDGERFYVDSFSDYTNDLHTFMSQIRSKNAGLPIFLLGHSAGGVIAVNYALDHPEELRGLICESFAYKVPAPDFALAVLKGLSHLAPHAHVLKLDSKGFSRDPKVMEILETDPLIANEVQPTKTVAQMVMADERLKRDFPLLKVPVLIIHGTADRVTRPEGSQEFYDHAGVEDKTLKMYDGYFHDPLSDLGKETVMADILAWIDARI